MFANLISAKTVIFDNNFSLRGIIAMKTWLLDLYHVQSVPITTEDIEFNSHLYWGTWYNIMWWSLSATLGRTVFFSGTPVSSSSKTDCHDGTVILLKMV